MRLTKNQSLYLGFGTLVLFFGLASLQISRSSSSRPRSLVTSETSSQAETTGQDVEGSAAPAAESEQPRFELKDFHRSETKDGKKLWEVTAKRGEYFPATNSAKVYDATLLMFRENDNTMELRAGEALIHLSGAALTRAETSGGVVLKYNKEGELTTDRAEYDRTKETLYAPGFVTISNESIEVTGTSLHGDLKTNEFILDKDVKSVLKPKAERDHEQTPQP